MTIRAPQSVAFLVGNVMSNAWRRFFDELTSVLNNDVALTDGTVPASRLVNAGAGLQGGGALSGDIYVGFYRYVGATANLPATGNTPGDWSFASDGCNAGESTGAGTGCPVCWSNGAWRIPGQSGAVTS